MKVYLCQKIKDYLCELNVTEDRKTSSTKKLRYHKGFSVPNLESSNPPKNKKELFWEIILGLLDAFVYMLLPTIIFFFLLFFFLPSKASGQEFSGKKDKTHKEEKSFNNFLSGSIEFANSLYVTVTISKKPINNGNVKKKLLSLRKVCMFLKKKITENSSQVDKVKAHIEKKIKMLNEKISRLEEKNNTRNRDLSEGPENSNSQEILLLMCCFILFVMLFWSTRTNLVREEPPTNDALQEEDSPEKHNKSLKNNSLATSGKIKYQAKNIGYYTAKGHVREENQDACIGFVVNNGKNLNVGIIADGMGGLPLGRYASCVVLTVMQKCLLELIESKLYQEHSLEELLKMAFGRLEKEIQLFAVSFGNMPVFRTTLIVTVVQGQKMAYLYSGDGGGWLVSENEATPFLTPQSNERGELESSIGVEIEGRPETGSCHLNKGQIVAISSDGFSEFVERSKIPSFLHSMENVQESVEAVVKSMSTQKDQMGYICSDNISLVVLRGDQ